MLFSSCYTRIKGKEIPSQTSNIAQSAQDILASSQQWKYFKNWEQENLQVIIHLYILWEIVGENVVKDNFEAL